MESFLVVSVIVVAYVLFDLRRSRQQAPVRAIELLATVERAVGVGVPLEVRDRLHPVVARRVRWPVFARSAGYVAVGLRGFPADPQHLRAARAQARLLGDFVGAPARIGWAISSVALVAVLPLALVITRAFRPAVPVLVLCLGSVLLALSAVAALRDDLPAGTVAAAAVVLVGTLTAVAVGLRSVSWRTQLPALRRRDVLT